jgi:F-type H+-transporting ATPase subunit b
MQINWFTVIAELINFLLLVWLLKRFLYKPVFNAIEERENKIKAQLQDAALKKEEAVKEQEEFRKKNDDFNLEKKNLMDKAVADTNAERTKMFDTNTNDANNMRIKLENTLKDKQREDIRQDEQKVQEQVLALATKTLSDLASSNLDSQTVTLFIKRLKDLNGEEKKQFCAAFEQQENKILVQTAFLLPPVQQIEVNDTINELLEKKMQVEFAINPGLLSGIELSTDGYKLAWSISAYLSSLEKSISEKKKETNEKSDNQ